MTKDELFDLFKRREKARAYYDRMSMQGIKHDASAEEKFEAEFRYAQAKREYENLSRQYQLAQDKYLINKLQCTIRGITVIDIELAEK